MKTIRLARLMLRPSLASWVAILGGSLLIMAGVALAYLNETGLFYEYLFGPDSSATLISSASSTIAAFNETVFGNPLLNKFLFFLFWMIVGLVVYVVISSIGEGLSDAEQAVESSMYVHAQRRKIAANFQLKVILRLIAAALLVIFISFFWRILLPFAVLASRIVAGDANRASNWIYGFSGYIVLGGSLYIGLVLLRFFALKPRLYGGTDDAISADVQDAPHKNE